MSAANSTSSTLPSTTLISSPISTTPPTVSSSTIAVATPQAPTTSLAAPITSSTSTPQTTSSTSTTTTSTSVQQIPTTSSTRSTTSTSTTPTTTSTSTTSAAASPSTTSFNVVTITPSGGGQVITVTQTSIESSTPTSTSSSSSTSASSTSVALGSNSNASSNGLSGGGLIAVAVVVPIVGVALLILAGLFFWRRRKQRMAAEEMRRKEVEDYGYNPNDDPTVPAVAGIGGVAAATDAAYGMREDNQGYRGWGTATVAGTSGRNPSTTMSTAAGPIAYSEGNSPTHEPSSETQSGNPLLGPNGRPLSGGSEVLGAMGPAAAGNRADINRGPSNASSSYSAANLSDASGDGIPGGAFNQSQMYSGDVNGGYGEGYGSPPRVAEMAGQPVIRDNLARRATRIENPSHYPQASAGISQNF